MLSSDLAQIHSLRAAFHLLSSLMNSLECLREGFVLNRKFGGQMPKCHGQSQDSKDT